jgi:hypothetical protein
LKEKMSQRANTYGFDEEGRYDGTEKYYWAFDAHLMDKLRAAGVFWVLEKLRTAPKGEERDREVVGHVERIPRVNFLRRNGNGVRDGKPNLKLGRDGPGRRN